jgi:hypothetical protein
MPTSSTPANRGTVAAVVAALIALIALIAWRGLRHGDDAPAATTTVVAQPRAANSIPRPPALEPALTVITRAAPPGTLPPAAAPVIDAIELEKQKICIGEENLVTIRAHTPGDPDDPHLQAAISGRPGFQVPLVGRHRDSEEDGEPEIVTVVGRDGVMTQAPVPRFEVVDCIAARQLSIKIRNIPNGGDEMELWASVSDNTSPRPLQVSEWQWDFGDGSRTTSTSPIVSHDFGTRTQDTLASTFLVTVTAVGTSGETVVGRREIAYHNRGFEMISQRGMVLIESRLTPRFATRDERGIVRQQVAVWHRYKQPVEITEVIRTRYADSGGEVLSQERLSPAEVFDTSTLLPGRPLEIARELDPTSDPRIAFDTYAVHGRTSDGLPAAGEFSIMVPPVLPKHLADMPNRVEDPMLAARIVKAQTVLGKRFVNDEDLYRLEREGAFDGLAPRRDLMPKK